MSYRERERERGEGGGRGMLNVGFSWGRSFVKTERKVSNFGLKDE